MNIPEIPQVNLNWGSMPVEDKEELKNWVLDIIQECCEKQDSLSASEVKECASTIVEELLDLGWTMGYEQCNIDEGEEDDMY